MEERALLQSEGKAKWELYLKDIKNKVDAAFTVMNKRPRINTGTAGIFFLSYHVQLIAKSVGAGVVLKN
jgi:hypothetical protein